MTTSRPLQPSLWRTCRVLANRTRLRLLDLLLKEPGLTVSAAAQRLDLTLPVASQSLRALEARGLLMARRSGRWVRYQPPVEDAAGPAALLMSALRLAFQREARPDEKIFKLATAFTHPRRIEVFRLLKEQARDFRQLKTTTRLSGWALRRHLRKLEARGFVAHRQSHYVAAQAKGAVERTLARLAAE